jgi:hypothetical protein
MQMKTAACVRSRTKSLLAGCAASDRRIRPFRSWGDDAKSARPSRAYATAANTASLMITINHPTPVPATRRFAMALDKAQEALAICIVHYYFTTPYYPPSIIR